MRKWYLAAAAAAVIASGAQAEEVVLKPTSKWHLDYAENKCRLARTFGEGERKTMFFLEQFQPGTQFGWTVAGKPLGKWREGRDVSVQFGPDNAPFSRKMSEASLEGFGAALIATGLAPVEILKSGDLAPGVILEQPEGTDSGAAPDDRIEWLLLTQGERNQVRLELGPMTAAFQAMNSCVDNLVAHWGLDPQQQRTRHKSPVWINGAQVARRIQQEYPQEALNKGAQAILNVRVIVDATGRPASCVQSDVTVADEFNDHACKQIMRHAKFEPAIGIGGQPIASFYTTRVVYQIGGF